MPGDEVHSLLAVFLLGELAERRRYYEITRSALWKAAGISVVVSQPCLTCCQSRLRLCCVVLEDGHPCPAPTGHSVFPPPLARGDPSSPWVAPVGCGSAGGTLLGRAWSQPSEDRLPFPGLLLRMPLKHDLGILSKSGHKQSCFLSEEVKCKGRRLLKQRKHNSNCGGVPVRC